MTYNPILAYSLEFEDEDEYDEDFYDDEEEYDPYFMEDDDE
jgi:hypothetical protein